MNNEAVDEEWDVLPRSAAGGLPTRVVVVDDDPRFVAGLGAALCAVPDLSLVGSAHDVDGACAMLSELRPDVALIDLGLGKASGLAVIGHARRDVPGCELLVVTMFEDDISVLAAIESGASGYVLKGCGADELRAHVREVHAGGSPISPRIARRLLQRLGGPGSGGGLEPEQQPTAGHRGGQAVLSPHELEMLQLAAKGCSHDEIARLMGVARNTVLTYAKRCYRKLQVHSRSEAVYEARRMGLLSD